MVSSRKAVLIYVYAKVHNSFYNNKPLQEWNVTLKNTLGIFLKMTKMTEDLDFPDDFLKYCSLTHSSKMLLKCLYVDEE